MADRAGLYPQFPLYIPSKGRADRCLTSAALCEMRIRHTIVVEPEQVAEYRKHINSEFGTVLELDLSFKEKYVTCDSLGLTKSTGPGAARNFIWEHSIGAGHSWHWVMDDNISSFSRLHGWKRPKCKSPAFFRAMEDFVSRYKNVAMAGPSYEMFAFGRHGQKKLPPFFTNTRIYSCNFIRNDVPFRWRGRYNEDTILSLDMLKAGWCTIQFYAFLQRKVTTQVMKGGNTEEFYHKEGTAKEGSAYAENGTLEKSKMQVRVHPDVSKIIWRYGRWHHHVNYDSFKNRKLIRRDNVDIPAGVNDYGMTLRKIGNGA